MTFSGYDVVFYTVVFVVPGFIYYWSLGTFIRLKPEKDNTALLKYLVVSCLVYFCFFWVPLFIGPPAAFLKAHQIRGFLLAVGICILFPGIIGFLTALARQSGAGKALIEMSGFRTAQLVPTGWDWKFANTKSRFVIVTLKDGGTIAGKYGESSQASDDPTERDLYLEEIYTIQPSGEWKLREQSDGILILKDTIKAVEFFKGGQDDG